MKTKNKKEETSKSDFNKPLTYVTVAVVIVIIIAGTFFLLLSNPSSQPKAALIDALSGSQLSEISRRVNETFVETAKEQLYKRFSNVDYYSDNATVDEYARLASKGYKMIIWRAHSAVDPNHYVAISSSEKNAPGKYEQYSTSQLKLCNITGDPTLYFAITPDFVKECMDGKFEETIVIFMSCNGLNPEYLKTAEAFINKGVKAFISWTGWIDSSDNDHEIALLLDYLISQSNTIYEAVNKTTRYNDPLYGWSKLDYYPKESQVADYRIPDYRQNNIGSNCAKFAVIIASRKKRLDLQY